ncbi:anterior gradient protein 2 homolog isoform X1 [Trichechus manatus latirostris]|uniref:Anterior gradient protein 2 homolog isoform X1 n=1 Tax=Trichechus manatus latirostris TaxID=127582 RepID=A0A2Y9R0Z9_TRIMA|nr:anterior gradient protein 2 homolog isoform X1 [Trichechus manatus latirostris]
MLKFRGPRSLQGHVVMRRRHCLIFFSLALSTGYRFAMEKISASAFLLLVALSYTLAKETTVKPGAKKDTKDSGPKLPQTLSRGWGDQLIWTQTYEEALYKSKTSNKPLMIIHHLDECPHSQALKKVFAENREIQKLAEQFVLLNLVYETTDKHLSPDGQYVPRILFVDPSLTVRADITGRYSNRLYAYEPSDVALCKFTSFQHFYCCSNGIRGHMGR